MVYNSTDTTRFDPAVVQGGSLRSRLGIAGHIPLVGLVGRFTVWKGHLDLVTAFAQVRAAIPDARLVLVGRATGIDTEGDLSYLAQIRQRISDLNLTDGVDWVDWVSDTPGLMKDLDVLALPSWEEPFGLVVTEAMAMERPVVAYGSGAVPEIITDGVDGLVVPPRDPDALAQGLVSLLRDPERRAAMGRRGRQRVVTDFGPRRQADEVTAVYRALARGSPIDHGSGFSALFSEK
jgi:glycosyltransferase involved in cell wall biosynthesis